MKQSVVCIASDLTEAEKLVQSLKNAGFISGDVSVLMPDSYGAQELGYEVHSKAPEGMTWGAIAGAIIGGLVAYLVAIGSLKVPSLLSLATAGPVIAVLAGVGFGALLLGLMGAVIGLSVPEYEVKKYERRIKFGSTLIAVHTDTEKEAKAAEQTFRNAGAAGIHRTMEDSVKRKIA